MSINSNFKANKCWSCEYYSGKREYKKGAFLGDSVVTDGRGKCCCKRSPYNEKQVSDSGWCSKYQKWGRIESALALEEQKRESKRIENEQRVQARKIQEANDNQLREIERENRRLERERYLSSLSPEEREELRKKEQEEAEAEKTRLKELRIQNKKEELENCKKFPIKATVISSLLTIVAFILGWIPYWVYNSHLNFIIAEIEDCEARGMDPNSQYVQYLYQQGLAAKSARNGSIWVPFVLLAVGVVITIVVVVNKKKSRARRASEIEKELKEL